MDLEKDILQDEQKMPLAFDENSIQEQLDFRAEEQVQTPEEPQELLAATETEEKDLSTECQEGQPVAGDDPVRSEAPNVPNGGQPTPDGIPKAPYNGSAIPYRAPSASYGAQPNAPRGVPNTPYGAPYGAPNVPYGMPGGANYGNNGQNSVPQDLRNRSNDPYAPGYYAQNPYSNPPYGNGNYYGPSYQGNMYAPAMQNRPAMPRKKKNRNTVVSLIFGALAVGIMNFFPFIGLVAAVIAVCSAFTGLKDNGITPGKKACGIIGMGLGVFALTISIAMLVMLLSMSIQVMHMGGG